MTERDGARYAALASPTRRRVLEALGSSGPAMDAQSIAELIGIHVTTVRFHLDQLEAADLVRRQADGEKHRGRPRVLYVAHDESERDDSSRQQLIEALAGALAGGEPDHGHARAVAAGRSWAQRIAATGNAEDVDTDASERLLDTLNTLGFEPVPEGDTVQLLSCPFRDAARAHPQVVCAVHSGLVQEILQVGTVPTTARLLPFVAPDRCAISLR